MCVRVGKDEVSETNLKAIKIDTNEREREREGGGRDLPISEFFTLSCVSIDL